ncbi:MAG: DUF4190 domain-containing protein [Lachnospiraceae bacterium]|nr:DUF4190 domain-containing protein [Lachnospiraceae bacterium]
MDNNFNNGNNMNGQQPNYGGGQQPQPTNGLAIAGLVLGLVGIVFTLVINGIVGIICAIVGLVLSIMAQKKSVAETGQKNGMATAGFILSIISLVVAVIGIIVAIAAVACITTAVGVGANEINDLINSLQ